MWIRGEVTQEYIDKGVRTTLSACPIALFLKAQTGMEAEVGAEIRLYEEGDLAYTCLTPSKAIAFMSDFDWGRMVKPTRFAFNFRRVER